MSARGILREPVGTRCPSSIPARPPPSCTSLSHALHAAGPLHFLPSSFTAIVPPPPPPSNLCVCSHVVSMLPCVSVDGWTCTMAHVWSGDKPRCLSSPSTSFETRSFVVLQADRPKVFFFFGGGGFSCLPSFCKSVGITGVHHCAWIYIGSWDSNSDLQACSLNTSPSESSPHPIILSNQRPTLIFK